MLLRVMGEEAGGEGAPLGKAEDAVKGTVLLDGFGEEFIGLVDGLLVVVHGAGPFVEAQVGSVVEALNPWAGG